MMSGHPPSAANDAEPETKPAGGSSAPSGGTEGPGERPPGPRCVPGCEVQLSILRDGLTNGDEPTTGASILSDALSELSGVLGLLRRPVSPHLNPEDLGRLLDGLVRRLNAALRLLRLEQGGAP